MKKIYALLFFVLIACLVMGAAKFDPILGQVREADAGALSKATSSDVTEGTNDTAYVTSKALKDANIRANVQQVYAYAQDFEITEALHGSLITNANATTNIKGSFAAGLPTGFWCDIANEVGGGGIDSYTKLILHLNNNATDSSASNHTITPADVTYSASGKFGYAGIISGATATFTAASSTDFILGASNTPFAVSFWFKGTSPAVAQVFSGGGIYAQYQNNDNKFHAYPTGFTGDISASAVNTDVFNGNWHHVVYAYNGTISRWAIDGVWDGDSPDATYTTDTAQTFVIGGGLIVEFDEFKVDNGITRWTINSNFTPPLAEYYGLTQSSITLTPASGEQLPGTAAADNTLTSSTKGDVKHFFNTGNSWISKYTTGTWTDGL